MLRRAVFGATVACSLAMEPDTYESEFGKFVTRFNKVYANEAERRLRFGVFKTNLMLIEAENSKGTNSYILGVNQLTDLTQDEFAGMYLGFDSRPSTPLLGMHLGVHKYQGETLADSVDWRTQGAVTQVKNQQQCGSCWTFSTTGALEGAWKIAGHDLVSLSEEQIVQCDSGGNGCGGGSMVQAFGWLETHALCTESSYPYTSGTGTTGTCSHHKSCTVGVPKGGVTGYKSVDATEQALMSALSQQPVSIAVEADRTVFQSYRSGVMTGMCGSSLDHGILAIGYGSDGGQDYWLVKNSWGTVWGEEGYGRLLRGKGGSGECGILQMTSYPVVTKAVDENEEAFNNFIERFRKSYSDSSEREHRFSVFKKNLKYIQSENAKGTNLYVLGVNHMTDLTQEEFTSRFLGFTMNLSKAPFMGVHMGVHEYQGEVLASSVDWRKHGAVTDVKNQQQCGSCWTFSTTGALEGAWKIAGHDLVSLSEEQIVQCDSGGNGCGGGSMVQAFGWLETHALCTESSYPYTSGSGTTGTCSHHKSCTVGVPKGGVTGYKSVGANEKALMSALSQQPVSIAVEADRPVFQSYRSGVMTGICGSSLDHGILAIGYGSDGTHDYWLVKNSWGTVWGEGGYGRLLRGKGGSGECGILQMTSYPVVSSALVVV